MRRKPKWWALILALVLILGSGVAVYKYPGYAWGRGHMGGFNKGFDLFDNKGHMSGDWDNDEWEQYCDEDDRGWGHHGRSGRGYSIYEMSEEDLALTPDELANNIATKMYGDDVVVEGLNVSEEGVLAYQLMEDEELVQIILINSEDKTIGFMYKK